MDVFIGGKSAIDLEGLFVRNYEDAEAFIQSYGYCLKKPEDQRFAHRIFIEAVTFIERVLLPDSWHQGVQPPLELLESADPRQLLVWASRSDPDDPLRAWSCAILRVMHTICHIEGVYVSGHFRKAREQITQKFERRLFRNEAGELRFGDKQQSIQLERIDWKVEKSRESIILKLLHKPGNVAETIYDLFGIRIVTDRLSDVLVAVKYLRQFHLVTFTNCNPARVRNTLIDLDRFRSHLESLKQLLSAEIITTEEFEDIIERLTGPSFLSQKTNPHSSRNYRALQLTCREMIRFPNPALLWLERLKKWERGLETPCQNPKLVGDILKFIEHWPGVNELKDIDTFFPFEVQIMDKEAYKQNLAGPASHSRYKRSQVRTARRRILAQVLKLHKIQNVSQDKT